MMMATNRVSFIRTWLMRVGSFWQESVFFLL